MNLSLEKFVGVWFERSRAIVPNIWIFKDRSGAMKCYWPQSGGVEEMARRCVQPDRISWSIWIIKEIYLSKGEDRFLNSIRNEIQLAK